MKPFSAVIITLNEEANIKECLTSVKFADEIIVVDTGSTDKTVEIAKEFTDKVFTHPKVTHVEPARKFAISKSTHDWVLLLDADERVPKTLSEKLQSLTEGDTDVYRIARKNIIFGKFIKHAGWWPDFNVRFFKKRSVEWKNEIHSQPTILGKVENLPIDENIAITHYNYRSISQYLTKMLSYTSVQASEAAKTDKVDWRDFITKPVSEFLRRYFVLEGYKDGSHGLILSFLQGFSEFVIMCKLWEDADYHTASEPNLNDVYSEYKKTQKEVTYWFGKERIHNEKNPFKKASLKVFKKRV